MELIKQFEKETGEEKPLSNGFLKINYQEKYIEWLEGKINQKK